MTVPVAIPSARRTAVPVRGPALAALALALATAACAEREPAAPSPSPLALPPAAPAASSAPAPPHFVVVVVDTLRSDRVGACGGPPELTPAIDALARESFVFRRAVAPASWTKPSIASLFTGLYPSRHGAVGSHARAPERAALDPALDTLAERLAAAGYATAAFVQNPHVDEETRFDQGFERFRQPAGDVHGVLASGLTWIDARADERPFLLYLHVLEPHAPYTPPADLAARFAPDSPGRASPFTAIGHPLELVVWSRAFREWTPAAPHERFDLDESTLRPDLLDPAILAELRRLDPSITRATLVERLFLDYAGLDDPLLVARREHLEGLYAGEVAAVDRALGRFAGELAARDLLARTVLVVASDHGESFLEHGLWGHGNGVDAAELAVPLLVRVPRHYLPAAARGHGGDGARTGDGALGSGAGASHAPAEPVRGASDVPVSLVDCLPTLLELAGLDPPRDVDGRSLVPLLAGAPSAELAGRAVFAEAHAHGRDHLAAVRAGARLVRTTHADGERLSRAGRAQEESTADAVEWTAFADGFDPAAPGVPAASLDEPALRELRAALEAFLARRAAEPPREPRAAPATLERLERLNALGY